MHEPSHPSRRTTLAWLMALAGASSAASCGGSSSEAPAPSGNTPAPTPPAAGPITATTFASGLDSPWGMAFLPDGRILVTLKGGSMVILSANGSSTTPVTGVPAVNSSGQGGLLDVALDPDFSTTPWVYFSYSENGTGGSGTAVARAQLSGTTLQNLEVIFRQSPKVSGDGHFGSRLVFRSDKTLFITLGERQQGSPAQDLSKTLGKVVRINRDGSIPADNPNLGAGALPGIWSYGHRNPQGAALHPSTGELWESEHGPQGGDEINISRSGRNYGWPNVSYGCNYGDSYPGTDNSSCRIGGGTHEPTYVEPLTYWVPVSIAPAGIAFYTGSLMPEWQGNLFVTALAGQALWRLTLSGNTVAARETVALPELATRLRDVRQGPDGALYVLTDGSGGSLLRIAR
ncbi:MAG: PQQ-dependent sugar dehydrogenase [Proteobacteria bacterium]|nr:PQQ-dependent sugar dehydrogenase [Pseudomonadota bacterium]